MPKVAIIIAVLNGIKTIGKSIESAQCQTEKDIEIVVIDDGSTDGTADYVKGFAETDPRIKIIKLEKNGGAAAATNIAIEQATGEWIAILDADDWYEPERIDILLKAAAAYNADLVCDNLKIFDHARGEIIESTHHGPKNHVMILNAATYFRRDNPLIRHAIGYTQPMIKKKFLADHKIVYNPSHRIGYDFIFVAEILLCGGKAIIVPGAYYVYVHMVSPTTRKISPYSHSHVKTNQTTRTSQRKEVNRNIVRGCDELLAKYANSMTAAEREALMHRRYAFETLILCHVMRDALREKRFFEAMRILLARPFILVVGAAIIGGLAEANIKANIKSMWNSLEKHGES